MLLHVLLHQEYERDARSLYSYPLVVAVTVATVTVERQWRQRRQKQPQQPQLQQPLETAPTLGN